MTPLRFVIVAVGLATLLAACSGGTADEARQGQRADAIRTPMLAEVQATRLAERYFPATPSPTPSPLPPPALSDLVVSLAVGAGNAPQGALASVPADAPSVFAAARLAGALPGHRVEGTWTDAFGNEVGRSAVEIGSAGDLWVAFPLRLGGALPAGEYAIYVDVDGRRLGSLAFTITGAGSAAQALPDLPANPQAPAATVAPTGQPTPPPIEPGGPPQGQ